MTRLTSTIAAAAIALVTITATIALAYSGSISMYNSYSPIPFPPEEKALQYNLVRLIYNAAYYGSKGTDTGVYVVNATDSDIAAAVTGWSGYLDTVHAFWYSHGMVGSEYDIYWEPHDIYGLVYGPGEVVWDNDIYNFQFSDFHPVKLAVIHSCHQGHVIGGTFIAQSTQDVWHYGMPQAWLYTTQLSKDGYNSPDGRGRVFIGWYNESPILSLDLFGNNDTMYKFFVRFYTKLYGYYAIPVDSVIDALDEATKYATNYEYSSFDNSPLYNGFTFNDSLGEYSTRMVVYGDGTYGSGPW